MHKVGKKKTIIVVVKVRFHKTPKTWPEELLLASQEMLGLVE